MSLIFPTIKIQKTDLAKELYIDLPGDKSISHRSIIAACIINGETKIYGLQQGEDCLATIEIFQSLGCEFDSSNSEFVLVTSKGLRGFDLSKPYEFDARNSGTTARLLLGLLSCIPGLQASIKGDESLSARPMDRVVDLLQNIGADIKYLGNEGFLPVSVLGKKLKVGEHLFYRASAQVKSAILLASSFGSRQSITLATGSRDHTEKLLPFLGYQVNISQSDQETVSAVLEKPCTALGEYHVPRDPSAMIFWLIALPVLNETLQMCFKCVLKNATRTYYLQIIKQLGFSFEWKDLNEKHGETRGDLFVTYHNQISSKLVDEIIVDGTKCIDEVPALSAIATVAGKTLIFRNVEELKIKESNRLDKTIELARLFGAKASYMNKELRIEGRELINSDAFFHSLGDHRLVMSYVMLCFAANSKNKVDSLGAHKVSYPHFLNELKKLGVTID